MRRNLGTIDSKFTILITLLGVLVSCGSNETRDAVIIRVILTKNQTTRLINKYVYLADVNKMNVADSELVKGDTVSFYKKY
ncbi:MAG TPA: hypothetical protein VGC95_02290, partial [Chitinophagaceae bacterium]